MTRAARMLLAVLAAALALPAAASADNLLSITNGEAKIRSDDAEVANAFEVEDRGTDVRFYEPKDPKGINAPPECRPGETRGGVAIEVFCPRSEITKSIAILNGPAEDSTRYAVAGIASDIEGDTGADHFVSQVASNDILDGEQGNDTIDAGPGDDELVGDEGNDDLKGGDGNDKLNGGPGLDAFDGGNGDDTIDAADGVAEKVACGAGNDTAVVDQLDEVVDCESVDHRTVQPPADQPAGDDKIRPKLTAAALTRQRVTRRRARIKMVATSSEVGLVQVTGYLATDGINERLVPARANVTVGGGGVSIKLAFSKRLMKLVGRDYKHHKTPVVHLTVSSVDAAGNTSVGHHLTIRLHR
jgi:Ca2+-binding RTX toxin-like protein